MTHATHALSDEITTLRDAAVTALATVESLDKAIAWERAYLGPKGRVTSLLRGLSGLAAEDRPQAGRDTQALRAELAERFEAVRERLAVAARQRHLAEDAIDVTLPGRPVAIGAAHPVSRMIDEVIEIFAHLGFQAVFGPEVETARYNFDLLNIPANHPARDVWDTIIVESERDDVVLRTHTSPMQARTMERIQPPVRVIVPGRSYRYEAQDASHEWMFTQLEGLAVDEHITLADLKGVLQEMARQLFGPRRRVRFRCDFFPFVEPGVDFAVDCAICEGAGCRVCKQSGWLEMGGAGMVHPNVLRVVGYDPARYTGFAFGLGIERIIMMKYGVDDLRAFAGNDLRFLRQFARAVV
ncbi:MAG: phenylalanine--tRNA ligase subunit alpha [Chloroflexia bacterium]|nr:phenylalanine--tRNA ligase subunit alpha [Chloroflexia bacterium]